MISKGDSVMDNKGRVGIVKRVAKNVAYGWVALVTWDDTHRNYDMIPLTKLRKTSVPAMGSDSAMEAE